MKRLRISTGGTSASHSAGLGSEQSAFHHPIWISFETQDIKSANTWLQGQNINILRPLTYHEDWLGTDIILTDVDGNPIQVVQYGEMDNVSK